MNLLDFRITPLWQVWEAVAELAAEDGINVAESELIGLAPLAALLDVADHAGAPRDADDRTRLAAAAEAIRLRDFDPLMALELRLAAAHDDAGGSG
jgi:glutamate formiminotransferase